ncbi:MAG: hypothetical protein NC204_06975 [Candidatus Amulumruptor caecigallinarius]|nr:hypothetical protein [Candidatus Amulumruptor caecigallinarius]
MRRDFIYLLLLPIAMLLWGCDVHEFPDEPEPGPGPAEKSRIEVSVQFKNTDWQHLTTVEKDVESGGSRTDVHALRYVVNIYKDEKRSRVPSYVPIYSNVIYTAEPVDLADVTRNIPVEIEPGEYSAVVWVDYTDAEHPLDDLYYTTDDFTYISFAGTNYIANTRYRECFRGATDFTLTDEGKVVDTQSRSELETVPVTCERPLGRFEFITTDLEEFMTRWGISPQTDGTEPAAEGDEGTRAPNLSDYQIRFRYVSYMPDTYNANTDKPIDSRLGAYFYGRLVLLNEHEASLGFDHVFVNHVNASVIVSIDILDREGNLISSSDPVTLPLKRNHHTIVKGKFLTAQSSGSMGIDPGFDGEFNIEL